MNYKFLIDEKKLKKILQPDALENESEKNDDEKSNSTTGGGEQTGEEKGSEKKQQLDYYMNQLDSYNGKTIDEIVRDKFQAEKQELDTTTDDELYQRAKDYADSYKSDKQTKLENTANTNKSKLQENAQKVKTKSDETQKGIEQKYQKNVYNSKNSAIKNGIARSSIIENLLSEHKNLKDEKSKENKETTESELKAINEKINTIEENLAVALKNLDMESAVLLNEELASLKSKRDEANLAVNKHNIWVEERIKKYKDELLNSDEGKAIIDYIESGSGELIANAKIALTKYIDELPVDVAIEELKKEEYVRLFGSKIVDELQEYLARKKNYKK